MMGMVKLSLGYKAPIDVTSYLYSTLVRSNLEHCSTVLSPFNFNEMQALESFQRYLVKIQEKLKPTATNTTSSAA